MRASSTFLFVLPPHRTRDAIIRTYIPRIVPKFEILILCIFINLLLTILLHIK